MQSALTLLTLRSTVPVAPRRAWDALETIDSALTASALETSGTRSAWSSIYAVSTGRSRLSLYPRIPLWSACAHGAICAI